MFLLNPFVFSQTQSGYALDPAKVKLLLHFDGNFNGSSPNNHAIPSVGNISIDTTDTKFGSGKLSFGNSPRDGYLRTTNTFFNFGENQPFTLCFWAKGGDSSGCYATTTRFELNRSGIFAFAGLNNWIFAHFLAHPSNWVHIAVVVDGDSIKGYLDGVQKFGIGHPNWPSENSILQFGKNASVS